MLKLLNPLTLATGILLFSFSIHSSFAQNCQSTVVIVLENTSGGFFPNQKVTLTSKVDGTSFTQNTNDRGEATLIVHCSEMYEMTAANYTKKIELESAPNGAMIKQSLAYAKDMVQREKALAMNIEEQAALDKSFESLPDTSLMKGSVMPPPKIRPDNYAMVIISIRNIKGAALENETVVITGRNRKKTLKAITDKTGRLITYLPKGDTYDINFKYHKGYYSREVPYTKGSIDIKLGFSYLGTKEIERRRKAEAERLLAEEKRLKEEREAFEKRCSALGLSLEDCHRKEVEDYLRNSIGISDTVVSVVMNRNKWQDKLVVVDVTGSMSPYIAQVALWYRLNHLKDKNLQFVLFNDGDDTPDDKKIIGNTGGIYYSKSKGVDSLDAFFSRVQAAGYGGDGPENNMEALIKGVKMAAPFKELVMIADNDAPVKDIRLLPSFRVPVHIVLCGSEGWVLPDYLLIAWKTKGSIHTMEEDITSLARLSEGQQITISGKTYRIMGGEFIELE